ncbi:tetratricopeptide repeat protein [Congregibacter sp.]|uniref:tetratricopeptide repeat protein n=1 Tax=Congregibacter sp. TaxID=2744308 RepID=UPI003F6BE651
MIKRFPVAAAFALIAFGTAVDTASASTAMELKTSRVEVPGTREVESGEYRKGITMLETALERAKLTADKAPVLVNLCVAHAAMGELERAAGYCEAAVDNGVDKAIAFNNRAVVKQLQGDLEASIEDLEKASLVSPGNRVVQRNLDRALSSRASLVSQS